jgi:hypothetical protein
LPAGVLDAPMGAGGVSLDACAATGLPDAAPDPVGVLDRVVPRSFGSSADLMTRAYVFVIPLLTRRLDSCRNTDVSCYFA